MPTSKFATIQEKILQTIDSGKPFAFRETTAQVSHECNVKQTKYCRDIRPGDTAFRVSWQSEHKYVCENCLGNIVLPYKPLDPKRLP